MERFLSEVSSFGPSPKVPFRLLSSNVANAAALFTKGQALILINQQFMDKVQDDSKTWYSVKAILAHEVAHHLYGHTLPSSPASSRRNEELQADFYSGMVLKQMGATLDEALSAVTQIELHTGSSTHPSKEARKTAVISGYMRPEELMSIRTGIVKKNEQFLPSISYARISIKDDPEAEYYLAGEDLLKVTPEGKVLMLAFPQRAQGDYSFKYEITDKTYAIDKAGSIWKDFHGVPVKHGQVDAIAIK